jgi:hypothetical protein
MMFYLEIHKVPVLAVRVIKKFDDKIVNKKSIEYKSQSKRFSTQCKFTSSC